MKNPLYKLAELSRDHLRKTDYSSDVDFWLAQSFANDLDLVLDDMLSEQISYERPLKALKYAPIVLGKTPPTGLAELYNAARDAFGQVRWTKFYKKNAWSKPFLHSFAAGEGIGPDGRLCNNKVILGLFLLGPGVTYPDHAHPAEEFYIVLTGNPEFKRGDGGFELKEDGAVILHHSDVNHAIRTLKEPLYAIYGWRGEIEAKSWYRNDMADRFEPKKYPKIKKS